MSFFTFSQNNSGGAFHTDLDDGIAEYVIIEAANADEANDKAERIGLYFDGVDDERDCPCCGDRWYPVSDRDADPTPLIYGAPPREGMGGAILYKNAVIHYADGRIEIVKKEADPK
jgi:hypothetical protein